MQSHFIIVLVLTFERFKQVSDIVLDQQRATQNAHDLVDRPADLKVVFDDSDEAISDNGNMYLYADSILGLAPESFDSQVLFDPFEKEFDLPPVLVKECDVLGRKIEVVRIVRERSLKVGRIVNDTSDGKGIVLLVPFSSKADGLIPQDVILPVKQVFSCFDNIVWMELLTYDEEGSRLLNGEEPGEIKVASIKHIAGQRFVCKPVHRVNIVDFCISNPVEYRYLRDDIDLGVNPDARFSTSELCPTEYRHTEVDGRGINSIEPPMQFKLLRDAFTLCQRNHIEGKLFIDTIVSESVGFRQHLTVDWKPAESEKEGLITMRNSNIREFPETPTTKQLTKHQNLKVAPMRERPTAGMIVVLDCKPFEESFGKKPRDLSENILPLMHLCSIFELGAKVCISKVRQDFQEVKLCA